MAQKRRFVACWASFFAETPVEGLCRANFFAEMPVEGGVLGEFFAGQQLQGPDGRICAASMEVAPRPSI